MISAPKHIHTAVWAAAAFLLGSAFPVLIIMGCLHRRKRCSPSAYCPESSTAESDSSPQGISTGEVS